MPKESQISFPHVGFPIRMEYMENDEKHICYFDSKINMEKYKARIKNVKKFKIDEKLKDEPYSN